RVSEAGVVSERPAAPLPQKAPSALLAALPVSDTIAAALPAPAVETPGKPAEPGKTPAIAARLAGWSARGRRLLAATPRWQLAVGAGIAVALCVLILAIAVGI